MRIVVPEKSDYHSRCYGPVSTTRKYKPRYLQKIQCQSLEAGYLPAEARREKCSFLRFASRVVGSLNEPVLRQYLSIHRNPLPEEDRKSTRLNSSHVAISYAVF